MIMRRKTTSLLLLALCLLLGWSERASAQHFDTFFRDSTLRLDYIFSGDSEHTTIYPEEHHLLTGWAGRRHHLDSLALRGNARLYVRDEASGKVIYCTSFNSLYQEWRLTDEAKRVQRAYENVFLIPYPKAPITVTMELSGAHAEVIATQVQRIDPTDILIHDRTKEPALPHEYLIKSGTAKDCIDLAILAEGYTEAEMPLFLKDARAAVDAIFSYEPFKSYREHFNVVAVRSTSKDSGVAVPREHFWPRTPYSSHFDTFYSERYLTTRRVKAINDALVGIPYEHLIILVNSDVYGGGGIYNSYLISSTHHKYYLPVIVHEFGHSFGGLTDEYFYEDDAVAESYSREVEPWEQNVTNLKDFEGKKWSHLIRKGTPIPTPPAQAKKYPVGLYEGAAYSKKGMYRPSFDCRMRSNANPDFCPACHLALNKLMSYYLDGIKKAKK